MPRSQNIQERTYCSICNRPILNHDIDFETGIAYCYGCNHHFPLHVKSTKGRDEIVIPQGTDFIRLRILRNELEISLNWRRNYQIWKALRDKTGGFPGLFITLAFLFNRTTIEVRSGYIKIDHIPFDLLPMFFWSSDSIKQLSIKPKEDEGWITESDSSIGLYAELTSGKSELLLWGLKKSTLLFIEQEIERVLKIVDKQ